MGPSPSSPAFTFPLDGSGAFALMLPRMSVLVAVYQYEIRDLITVRQTVYKTREAIIAEGGKVLEETAKQVPGYEVTNRGLWKPDRNPIT